MFSQLATVVPVGLLQNGDQILVNLTRRFRLVHFPRYRQPDAPCELLHRLGEAHVLVFHEKPDRRTVRAAAEAVVELFVGTYRKRGGFLVMEWATCLVVFARFGQWDARIDNVDDVGAHEKLIDETLRDPAGHGRLF